MATLFDLTKQGLEPQTSRSDSNVLATELTSQSNLSSVTQLSCFDHISLQIFTRSIIHALSLPTRVWVGGSDEETEGTWKWVNGDIATDEQLVWRFGQPNNSNDEDCLEMRPDSSYMGRSNDGKCHLAHIGLCEKSV